MKLVVVHWLDADCEAGWTDKRDIDDIKDTLCLTIGLWLRPNKRFYRLCSGYHDTAYSEVNRIPRGMAEKIVHIGDVDDKGKFKPLAVPKEIKVQG